MDSAGRHRVDLWLKLVCLFKHRADATEACKGGHVRVNGQRVKPSAVIREGDLIELFAGEQYRRVVIEAIPTGNVSKEVARTMYRDETPVRPKVERPVLERERGSGRPTKRERREIDRLKR